MKEALLEKSETYMSESLPPSEALDLTMKRFGITGVELSRASGVSTAQISQFRKGKLDIASSNLIKIINSLSREALRYYLALMCGSGVFSDNPPPALDLVHIPVDQAQQLMKLAKSLESQLKKKSAFSCKTEIIFDVEREEKTEEVQLTEHEELKLRKILAESLRKSGLSEGEAAKQVGVSAELIYRIIHSSHLKVDFSDQALKAVAALCYESTWQGQELILGDRTYADADNYEGFRKALLNGNGVLLS